ncbi:ketosynthase chain-length factor [Saccharopolyspora sp. 5N708]|uniref:ketosynthase chain-length factor n=1 Tax=Saccharopolyspora sp. 5N708 TaxID=3457424 RepID=UPI003FD32AC7
MSEAVVTGLGVVAPNGLGVEEYWAATLKGINGIAPITRFDGSRYPTRLAGEVDGFDAAEHLPSRLLPQTDRMTQLALLASDLALADAGVASSDLAEFDMGVVTASASGGFEFGQRELEALWSRGPGHVSAYQSFAWFYAVNTGQISIRHGMRGPSGVLVAEQAGGLDALAQGRRHLRRGTGLVISGGVDSSLCPWGLVAQLPSGALSTADDPDAAYLPFDTRASGWVPGEGGAILVLERPGSVARRGGPPPYGTIAGWAATVDPAPGSGRPPGLARAIANALDDARTAPEDVDVVFADAAATPELDRAEADAITAIFGPRGVPVAAPKTMTGRLYSGGAALDVVAALLSIRDGLVPPAINTRPAEERIDLVVATPRPLAVRTALVVARGHGGFNSALVVRAAD